MPRQELVTADIINQIESWVDAGLSPKAIAEKIDCTLGTLKVRCAQLGISLRRKTHVAMRDRGAVGDTYAVFNECDAIEREFKGSIQPAPEDDNARATVRLPGLRIEIVRHRSPEGDSEQISITLQATPSFEAFGRSLDLANPLAFWAEAARLAFLPLEAMGGMMLALAPPQRQDRVRPAPS